MSTSSGSSGTTSGTASKWRLLWKNNVKIWTCPEIWFQVCKVFVLFKCCCCFGCLLCLLALLCFALIDCWVLLLILSSLDLDFAICWKRRSLVVFGSTCCGGVEIHPSIDQSFEEGKLRSTRNASMEEFKNWTFRLLNQNNSLENTMHSFTLQNKI